MIHTRQSTQTSKSSLPTLILSVPHANPIGAGDRHSLQHALQVDQVFEMSSTMIINKTLRISGKVDYNRHHTPWPQLTNLLTKVSRNRHPCLHLDIHSFDIPPKRWKVPRKSTVVIMAEGKNYQLLQKLRCPFPVVKGSSENRNIVYSRKRNIPALLIEFLSKPIPMSVYQTLYEFCLQYLLVYQMKYKLPEPVSTG